MNLESKRPPGPLFRVGRDDDAWAVPDWAYAKEDGTFGNRFDDPMRVYRVLYASSQRLGCFIETLARFRVDVSFVADLALMENGEDDFTAFGTVRQSVDQRTLHWHRKCRRRVCGSFMPSDGSAISGRRWPGLR